MKIFQLSNLTIPLIRSTTMQSPLLYKGQLGNANERRNPMSTKHVTNPSHSKMSSKKASRGYPLVDVTASHEFAEISMKIGLPKTRPDNTSHE